MQELKNYLVRAFLGKQSSRAILKRDRSDAGDYFERLRALQTKLGECPQSGVSIVHSEAPIFIFSAGWRSGSTLLQRMLMQHREDLIVWGEPYDRANLFDRMMLQLSGFTAEWPPERFFYPDEVADLSDSWVANLYPGLEDLISAHRAFFDRLFSEPAKKMNYQSWGIKDVRLTAEHAYYLQLLYPRAKFVFLVRNPLHAFASYRPTGEWYRSWPDKPVFTPYDFGKNWSSMAGGYSGCIEETNGILIRYEDLTRDETVASLESYLGWKISKAAEVAKIGSSKKTDKELWVPKLDRLLLKSGLGGAEKNFGYSI